MVALANEYKYKSIPLAIFLSRKSEQSDVLLEVLSYQEENPSESVL